MLIDNIPKNRKPKDAPFGFVFLDRDLRFVRINERLAEINGCSVAAHLGETVRAPGITRHWNESWYPVQGEHGEIIGFGAVVVEITARKHAEAALRLTNDRFELAVRASKAVLPGYRSLARDEPPRGKAHAHAAHQFPEAAANYLRP